MLVVRETPSARTCVTTGGYPVIAHAKSTYTVLVDAVTSFFRGQPPEISWLT